MPTRFTDMVSKLLYVTSQRKSFLQSVAAENSIAWEYVPLLQHIRGKPGCIQADISDGLNVTAAAVTQSTKKLEAQGLILKKTNERNLRIKQLYITEKGCEMLENGTKLFDMADEIMFDGFSESESEEFRRLLDKINKNLENRGKSGSIDEKHLPWEFGRKERG
ncbi:MAG: MarR family winged helix-turn-helix transcriptional regulator [Candidatus Ornithomonoglobus sp.]